MKNIKIIFILSALLIVTASFANAKIIYVTQPGAGVMDGTSWGNAYAGNNLQTAINAAASGDIIWVAKGTYYPTQRTINYDVRSESFIIPAQGVSIYGSFVGNELSTFDITTRDFKHNSTIVSGDIGIQGDNSDNTYHVFTAFNITAKTVIDGFTITAGHGNEKNTNGTGAGITIMNGDDNLTISNCIFSNNYAFEGGAVSTTANSNCSPLLLNCIFYADSALANGAVIASSSNVSITTAPAVSNVVFMNCLMYNNAALAGGLIYNTNDDGKALYNSTFINCTISGNTSKGDTIFLNNGIDEHLFIFNSIIWKNTRNSSPGIISPNSTQVSYSIIEGASLYPGQGNINSDPLFVNPSDPADNGFMLQCTSPGIASGSVNLPSTISLPGGAIFPTHTDLTGATRIDINSKIDMGAYESSNSIFTATISTTDILPICSGSTATINFQGTPRGIVTYNDGGANATLSLNASGNASFTTPALNATTTYNLVSITVPPCTLTPLLNGTITITVSSSAPPCSPPHPPVGIIVVSIISFIVLILLLIWILTHGGLIDPSGPGPLSAIGAFTIRIQNFLTSIFQK